MIRLRLLGPLTLERSEHTAVHPVHVRPKEFGLLAYLAASHPPGPRRRDRVRVIFWPESDREHARNSLRQSLYNLRASLGAEALTGKGDEWIGVNPQRVWCDATAFDEALNEGRVEEALELYQGPFLEGFHLADLPEFERWTDAERHRHRLQAVETAWALAEAAEAEGDKGDARTRAEQALGLAPYDEEGLRRYVALMARLGQPAAAVRAYRAFSERLAADLDLQPSAETTALVGRIRDGDGPPADLAPRSGPARGAHPPVEQNPSSGSPRGDDERIRSLAVLPLENLSSDPEQEHFTDGMTEALIAELGRLQALEKVTSRTSVMRYRDTGKSAPEIARELGVDALLEGSVLRAEDGVRITLRLVHGPTDRHVWSKSYQRDLRDVLTLQKDVAQALAAALRLTVTPQEEARLSASRPVHPEAYAHYMMANSHLSKISEDGFRQAVEHYGKAIAADSEYAPAWAGLAMAYHEMNTFLPVAPGALRAKAKDSALKALEIDPDLPEAHIAIARIKQLFEWDLIGADRAFRRGIELNPTATPARVYHQYYLILMGRFGEARAAGRRTVELDPLNPQAIITLAWALHHLKQHAEVRGQCEKAAELAPGLVDPPLLLAESYVATGDLEEALRHAARSRSLIGEIGLPTYLTRLAYVYARAGQPADAREILASLEEQAEKAFVSTAYLALIRLALDQKENALELLETAYQQHDPMLPGIRGYYMFDPLRDEPRFRDLLGRFDFPDD